MILTRTPLRISFFGGGTDYPVWFRQHGGAVLATAIDKYSYVSCRRLPPFFEHHTRVSYQRVESVRSNDAIEQPIVRSCLQYLAIDDGLEIHYDTDLPGRTGLGSSSAFTVGMLQALRAYRNRLQTREELARDAIRVEQEVLGDTVGVQDQITAAYGGFNVIEFFQDGGFRVQPVCAAEERLEALERCLVLCFTGVVRTASEIASHQVRDTPSRAAELRQMQAMVGEGLSILLDPREPIEQFGRLLHRAWQLKRTLTDRISTPAVDRIYDAGRDAGALGGKLLGAGGGGFVLFFVTPEVRARFDEQMRGLLQVPFRFSRQGCHVVLYEPDPPTASRDALRVRAHSA